MRKQVVKEIVVATRNKKKLKEIREIMQDTGIEFLSLADFQDAPYIREDGKTFSDNAARKAVRVARFTKRVSLGEDSGLCIDALGGAPGIYSSRFSGVGKSDLKNNLKVLRLLKGLPLAKRRAHYVCAVAIADKDGLIGVVGARCSGFIGFTMKGNRGFGYDPIFIVSKYQKTFAQLGEGTKHKISHRYKALKKARITFQKHFR